MGRSKFDFSRFVADASGLAALGAIAASLISLWVPHKMTDPAIALMGGVAGLLLAIIIQLFRRGDGIGELLDRLEIADSLFRRGILNEDEWQELRSLGLRKYDAHD